ncbi:AraC family transcriptional regulator [Ructibacterium gallinarum]|uniref:Helix-turn-helix transcriptional regulator n=1 Tax=Ructibacterium gallinarum TaxID=2779355 RepID=A0A9D5LX27_9FIRM|nr:AraC family transcriptional regulator [Ructibacterium gallinarum]MBE5039391.1 helix-turn-helix transcriptional regulator [Ructibacterium gallinarum]
MELEHVLDEYNCTIPYGDMQIIVHRFTRMETDGGLFAPIHMHKDYEFHYVVSGKAKVSIEDAEFEVSKGDIYFTKPYVNHAEFSFDSDPMISYSIECQIIFADEQKSKIDRFEIGTMHAIMKEIYYQSFHDDGSIVGVLDQIRKENREKQFGYYLRSKIMIMECIIKTIQIVAKKEKFFKPKLQNDFSKMRASSIKNYIDVNITNNVCLEDICKYVFLSEKQVNRIFFEKFDQTVTQYILESKFELAKKLLLTTNENLENIAVKAGFTGYQQMYRVFERKLNISPNQYRASNGDRAF